MKLILLIFSCLIAERSEHFEERCWPSGVDKECNFQCIKTFVFQMKDHSTVVTENRAQLKACKLTCKTKECQPTTKPPPTTKPTTTRRIPHKPVTKIENFTMRKHQNSRNVCPSKRNSRGSDRYGKHIKYCTRLLGREDAPKQHKHMNSRQRLSSGYYSYEFTCSYSCTRKYS